MNFNHLNYVPCLRWKQGEYQAVFRLPKTTKKLFIPLIEIPEIGWDFEEKKDAKTIDEHLDPFAKRVHGKWGKLPCFVDMKLIPSHERMDNGIHPMQFIFDNLRSLKCSAIPVVGFESDDAHRKEIETILSKDKFGACLRLKIEQAAKNTIKENVDELISSLKASVKECDLILDLDAPNFIPLEGFASVIQNIIKRLPYMNEWRTFTILGTSFPESMGGFKEGAVIIPRYEWQLYKILIANFLKAGLRLPTFADYGISHPKVYKIDMRLVKPYATIRYTIDDNWYIIKGKNVRDYSNEQYRDLCKILISSSYYCGSTFSFGDRYIQECADGSGKTGHLPMWRQVGTNHHIEKVTRDIANFHGSSNNS